MHCRAASFDGSDNLEAGIVADLVESTDDATCLLEQDIPRPRGGASTNEDALLALHQGLWETGRVAHHAIDKAVEQQLHLSWYVAPIAGRTHDDGVSLLHHLQHALRVVLNQHTLPLGAARHTAYAGFDAQVVGTDHLHLVASLLGFLLHDAEHL